MKKCCKNCVHSDKDSPANSIKIPCRVKQMLVQKQMCCESYCDPDQWNKTDAYILVCTNGDGSIVSCKGFRKLDAARDQMQRDWRREHDDAVDSGYDADTISGWTSHSRNAAELKYGDDESNHYIWSIQETEIF